MIQPGERFIVEGKTLEAIEATHKAGCKGCAFESQEGCIDPNHDSDCFDLMKGIYVIFKEI